MQIAESPLASQNMFSIWFQLFIVTLKHFRWHWKSSLHFLTAKSDEKLNDVPEHDKGEADKETKGAAEVRNKGVKGIYEVLSEDGGGQRPVS